MDLHVTYQQHLLGHLTPLIPVAKQPLLLFRGLQWPGSKSTILPSEKEEKVSHTCTAGPFSKTFTQKRDAHKYCIVLDVIFLKNLVRGVVLLVSPGTERYLYYV